MASGLRNKAPTANEADLCEKSFKGTSPLTEMNKLVHDVSTVAAAMTKILLF